MTSNNFTVASPATDDTQRKAQQLLIDIALDASMSYFFFPARPAFFGPERPFELALEPRPLDDLLLPEEKPLFVAAPAACGFGNSFRSAIPHKLEAMKYRQSPLATL